MNTPIEREWLRVSKRNPCPVCGKPDWCLISQDGKAAICARIESDNPVGNMSAGWLHKLDCINPLPRPRPRPDAKETSKAATDVVDNVYGVLLAELQLSETHRANLRQRGITDVQIDGLGYRTLPANERREVVKRLQAKGARLAGVPGFYLEARQWKLAGPVGIAIPVRDTKGRIQGLQVRCDNADARKYRWLSSRGLNSGCSPGAPVHVAGPLSTNGEVWITEGPLKADIAALKLGRLVLAVPGVGNWPGMIPIVRELTPGRAIVAFDMDKISNPTVKLHKDALITYLIGRGVRTFEADWDSRFKGIDDLLATGGQ